MGTRETTMEAALGEQVGFEFESAYLYLAFSSYLNRINLAGAGHWMRMQAAEELTHAMKLVDFMADRDWNTELPAIAKPRCEFDSALDAFRAALEHEQTMTARLNELMNQALELRDHATASLLQWFVTEQVEEEATLREIIPRFQLVGRDGSGLYLLDQELGKRPAPPLSAGSSPA